LRGIQKIQTNGQIGRLDSRDSSYTKLVQMCKFDFWGIQNYIIISKYVFYMWFYTDKSIEVQNGTNKRMNLIDKIRLKGVASRPNEIHF